MINRAVVLHTFQQHHWTRLSFLGMILFFTFLTSGGVSVFPFTSVAPLVVWVLGAGTIGRDMASGVNHLLFTRPLSRREYVLTKWASLALASAAFQVCQFLFWAAACLRAGQGMDLGSWEFWHEFGSALWVGVVLSTVVILFSTLMTGWGDLALLLYVHAALLVVGLAASNRVPNYSAFNDWALRVLWPGVWEKFQSAGTGVGLTVDGMVVDAVVAVLWLFLAVKWMERKDVGNMAS